MLEQPRRTSDDGQELRALQQAHEETVLALATALELRDDETGGHTSRVADLALALAAVVAPDLAEDPCLRYGFLLHDIGKIGIADAILQKPGRLDEAETQQIQMHTTLGVQLVSRVPHLRGVAEEVIGYHHERWDGSGYPWGLAGEDIPRAARIFAVADAFDAMTNARPYHAPMPWARALEEIIEGSGTQFDPVVVDAFSQLVERLEAERGTEETWDPVHVPDAPDWAIDESPAA